jgi:flagellar protein FliS
MSANRPGDALGQYRATNAYGATAADRLQLVLQMLRGAIDRIATARGHLRRGEVAGKGEQIGRAIGLVDGLRTCLDAEQGGEIAANLDALYAYMLNRLMAANVKDDEGALIEVADLLNEIKSGWELMAAEHRPRQPEPAAAAAPDA